jgi:glycosyltransferase involved in cell wall biosynthesis
MSALQPASVLVTTFNDGDILRNTLAAFCVQSFSDFELIVADDGSTDGSAAILREWSRRFSGGIVHVFQENRGFRRARILNRAVHASRFRRLIFGDMDCLPHVDFIRNHLRYLEPGTAVTGRRAHVAREVIPSPEAILRDGLGLSPRRLLQLRLLGKARVIEHGFVAPFFYEASSGGILGSNFSICREDFEAVNGFSEAFEGWGGEDTDLGQRLQRHGVRLRNLRNKVVQFHLAHAQRNEDATAVFAVLERNRREGITRAADGLAKVREGNFEISRYPGSALG